MTARWEAARPELEASVRASVVAEFWRRLPERSDWRLEGSDGAGELVSELALEHLEPVFLVVEHPSESGLLADQFALDLICRLDFPLPAEGDSPVALVDALPNVRFVDIEVRLRAGRAGFSQELSVELLQRGAWHDESTTKLVRSALHAPGVTFVPG